MCKKLQGACNDFNAYSSRVLEKNSSQLTLSARHGIKKKALVIKGGITRRQIEIFQRENTTNDAFLIQ